MTKENLYILLNIINRRGSIEMLTREGLDYYEIGKQTTLAIEEGLLENSEEGMVLTQKGIVTLTELAKEYKRRNKKKWIELSIENKISQIDVNDIYLPNKEELYEIVTI